MGEEKEPTPEELQREVLRRMGENWWIEPKGVDEEIRYEKQSQNHRPQNLSTD